MAVTTFVYNDWKEKQLNGNAVDMNTDEIKISLHLSTYSPDIDVDDFWDDITNELAASGNYTAGGEIVSTPTVTQDNTNDRGVFDAVDLTWTALTPSAPFRYGVLYFDSGTDSTSQLIGYYDFGANQDPGGSNFTIQFHADGILYI